MLKEVLKFISKRIVEREINFDKTFFKITPSNENSRVFAVDGGSSILIDGGTWLISKLRVGKVGYSPKKILEEKKDFYSAVINVRDNYFLKIFPDVEIPKFNLTNYIREITEIPSIMMKFLELYEIKNLVSNLNENEIVLADSLLTSEIPEQNQILNEIIEISLKRNVILVGISKTSRINSNGRNLIGYFNKIAPKSEGYFKIMSDKKISNFVVKFHKASKYCFRLQIPSPLSSKINEIISKLCIYSSDLELLGYPYPLLKADKIARISEYEKRQESGKLKIFANELNLDFLDNDIRSIDLHKRLDERMYKS